MRRSIGLPLLIRRGRTWVAKVRIPADVRSILGRSVFVRSTGLEEQNEDRREPQRKSLMLRAKRFRRSGSRGHGLVAWFTRIERFILVAFCELGYDVGEKACRSPGPRS